MDREVLDRWCERGILGSVITILLFTPVAFGGKPQPLAGNFLDVFVANPFVVAQFCTVIVLILWAIRLWTNPRPKLLCPPVCWLVVAFVGYAIVRYFVADIEYVARQELMRVLVYAFLFFAILNNLHRQEFPPVICFALIGLAVLLSSYAIFQFLTDSNHVWHVLKPYRHRGTGTYISPNHLGGFLEMLLPLAIAYTLIGRQKMLTKVFLGYSVLIIVAGIAVTVSRGSWFSTALVLLIFFGVLFFYERYRWPSFIFLFVMLMALGFFFPKTYAFQVRIKQLFAHGKLDDDKRFELWQPAVKVWEENPLWGAGPGHYDFRFRKYRPETVQMQPDRAHNDFLNAMVDWGCVGAAIIASTLLLLYWGVLRTWRFVRAMPSELGEKQSNKFAFVLGGSLGLLAVLFHSSVDFNMHIPANALLAITLMALLASYIRFATERYWTTLAPWARVAVTVVMAAGVTFIGYYGWRNAMEKRWLAKASQASRYSPEQAQLLQKAFAIEPKNFETAYGIGEAYRIQSKEGGENYMELASHALKWFEKCMQLNMWDGYGYLRYGMCLDWVERPSESGPYFTKAEELDPNGYFTVANVGLHYVQTRNYAAAKTWFERSWRLQQRDNPIASNYIEIVNRRLMEAATNHPSTRLDASVQ